MIRTPQFSLLFQEADLPENTEATPDTKALERRFIAPDPADISVGNVLLKQYLVNAEQRTPIIIAEMLDQQNWSAFEAHYASSGRPPYAPRHMMGLILYGIMQGVTSLRALEKLAKLDLGCMWISGGIHPDHANIGRFINMHEPSLTGEFFDALTRSVLKKTNPSGQRLAGDGTTIEAACSNYNLIKEEAARAALEEAHRQAEKHPEDPKTLADLEQTADVLDRLLEQKQNRKDRGRKAEETKVSPTEPEAIVQKMKRNRGFAPGYTPSILVNEKRVVVGQAVDPTNEI
ncbi:transposase [Endozoicomonas numazuensis]|uniref:transposase n=1 Tax=Endozoicomonas numazuensis TaxID=1137799 RepID=UPI000A9DBE32|nr:transposase [Endozoicomonas numazuensis]